jgi:hypothetical protein
MSGSASFQKGEEIFVGRFRLGTFACHRVNTTDLKMDQCASHNVQYAASVIQELLELGSRQPR